MKAWLLDDFSGVGSLRLGDAPEPAPQAGDALLEVHYAALNPADGYLAERQYPARPRFPHILGRDGMGRVMEQTAAVSEAPAGNRMMVLRGDVGVDRPGTFAQRVAVPVENLVAVPAEWSDAEAAGATLVYLTAYQALTMWGPMPPATVVLVTGASGGVGVAAVQLAAAMNHTVIGLSRSSEKSQRLRQLGAAATFNPEEPSWRTAAKNFLKPRRVGLAIDNVGGKLLPDVIDTLGELGKVSIVGRLAGPIPSFNSASLLFRRLQMGGVAVSAWSAAQSRSAWEQILRLLSRTGARPLVDSVFPFEQLPQAFQRLAQGPLGKVVLQVGSS